ncbi:pyridoxamine 5'-phosphate oxidase [Massilia sp. Root418]|jgi:PPOX class probable FMN-dependent enzyme|uniref:pyridoxamine 5'-phosphate oxidase family protein n=1 Tax=Massilia sp. Root418 TaxID=1736532 RepID=UPI0006F6DEF4|nr:pyridoxamine 5'-phosphate oxidase family protein [Massilia sp. Root418]KQW93484.1 pyridoxamine 5'-phosphate oxidase [Massilia sp. Root418]
MDAITTLAQLEALFGEVAAPSRLKEVAFISPHYRALIAASPFAMLATSGPDGLDASPRGDAPGFVAVEDEHTLLLPERRGNNRADSLRNIIADPRVALLFLIPGVGETLRVNGKARILAAPALLQRFAVAGQAPKCVVEIKVETAYFQCARAVLRSKLWDPAAAVHAAGALPSAGAILAALTRGEIDGEAYDQALPARQRSTLY